MAWPVLSLGWTEQHAVMPPPPISLSVCVRVCVCCTLLSNIEYMLTCTIFKYCHAQPKVIPEWAAGGSCAEEPRPACAKLRDTSEYIVKQTIGDTFPEVDKLDEPEAIGFGMGERAQYVYIDPSRNLSVVTMGQSFGTSTECSHAYDDGFTLGLIWKLLHPAITPKKNVDASGGGNGVDVVSNRRVLPLNERPAPTNAPFKGTARTTQGGDRTWATMRSAKQASIAESSGDEFSGSCLCQCPPDQGFGKCWNVKKTDVPTPPKDGFCPPHVQKTFPGPQAFCPQIGTPMQCLKEEVGTNVCKEHGGVAPICTVVPGSTELATANCHHPFDPPTWTDLSGDGTQCVWQETECVYSPYFPA